MPKALPRCPISRDRPARARGSRCGLTLLELLISLLILCLIVGAVLTFFVTSNRVASDQLERAAMQQSVRVAQHDMVRRIRMLGRGGLPADRPDRPLPDGVALAIRNNVEAGTHLLADDPASPELGEKTDVLTLRGVFDTPIYLVDYRDEASYEFDPASGEGIVVVPELTPLGGIPQQTRPLLDLLADEDQPPEALILTSPYSDRIYGVVELDHHRSAVGPDPADPARSRITLGFRTRGGRHAAAYEALSAGGREGGRFPAEVLAISRVGTVAVLEEYHYYIRLKEPPADRPEAEPIPVLARARLYPATDVPWHDHSSHLHVDVADYIPDLQIALALDLDGNGTVDESPTGADDEWLLNAPDELLAPPWRDRLGAEDLRLRLLRLTTLARSQDRAGQQQGAEIVALEDRDYAGDPLNLDRRYQRAVLRTVIDLRNL